MVVEEPDGWQEALPLQAVAIQVFGLRVRCCDEHDAAPEQAFQKAAEDHRIADVGNEELVEAQNLRLARY